MRLEEELWREDTRFDRMRMNDLLATDFFEFGGSGAIHDREATLAIEPSSIGARLPLPNFQARLLAANVAQVTYDSVVTAGGTVQYRRRSSIWTRTPAGWEIRFHQGTRFEPERDEAN